MTRSLAEDSRVWGWPGAEYHYCIVCIQRSLELIRLGKLVGLGSTMINGFMEIIISSRRYNSVIMRNQPNGRVDFDRVSAGMLHAPVYQHATMRKYSKINEWLGLQKGGLEVANRRKVRTGLCWL